VSPPLEPEFWDIAAITTAHRPAVGAAAWQLHKLTQAGQITAAGIVLPMPIFTQICHLAGILGKWPDRHDIQAVSAEFQAQMAQIDLHQLVNPIQQHWQQQHWSDHCQVKISLGENIDNGLDRSA
jgi:hypothetical protein